ncbi:hypothetical protein OTU49_013546 [Cherax quadricarinatus]|uniref:Uncharacterized protein n=1 Tax=Cherax quadricarinatus TaxID=27406 RepID=A0AAW0VT27_CHEQU|nr:uncharacterized protein LOC128699590 [Cherax quadricarinatus]
MFYPVQMEDQATHITKLMEENRRYIRENGKMKKNWTSERRSFKERYDTGLYDSQEDTAELVDRVLALQLQNTELNVCLEKEKIRRRHAEARLERDESYIKRLEDSVQSLRGTRVVMDPGTYRQVAEAYIAARRTPARRPHTHQGLPHSDLVCDSSQDDLISGQSELHRGTILHSSSWPSSPRSGSSPCPSPTLYPSQDAHEYPLDLPIPRNLSDKKDRGLNSRDVAPGVGVPAGAAMTAWDYEQLLSSLSELDGTSRGALS